MDEKRQSKKSNLDERSYRLMLAQQMDLNNITELDLLKDEYQFDGIHYWILAGSQTETILTLKGVTFDFLDMLLSKKYFEGRRLGNDQNV